MFVDEVVISVHGGDGGDGCVAFRREKYVPRGGPSGGDGGNGGAVVLRATRHVNTLFEFRGRRILKAERGAKGQPKNMHGRGGADLVVDVPVGTLVFDDETDTLLADLVEHDQTFVCAHGGHGGRGNARFVSATNQVPRSAEPGTGGHSAVLRLELKLLADVGLLGYPSVGKSTLIRAISNARPQVAEYPFTTLTPHLGVVPWKGFTEFVVADIPGLIEGASEGRGLGLQFLRHVERTRLLAHLIEVTPQLEGHETERDPIADFERINAELEHFDPALAERPQVVVLNKADLPFVREREAELRVHFAGLGLDFFVVSAATGEGVQALVDALGTRVAQHRKASSEAPER